MHSYAKPRAIKTIRWASQRKAHKVRRKYLRHELEFIEFMIEYISGLQDEAQPHHGINKSLEKLREDKSKTEWQISKETSAIMELRKEKAGKDGN